MSGPENKSEKAGKPDDSLLDEFLAGGSMVSKAYHGGGQPAAPAELEEAVLKIARDEAGRPVIVRAEDTPENKTARQRRLRVSLAVAATVTLSLGVMLNMREDQAAREMMTPSAEDIARAAPVVASPAVAAETPVTIETQAAQEPEADVALAGDAAPAQTAEAPAMAQPAKPAAAPPAEAVVAAAPQPEFKLSPPPKRGAPVLDWAPESREQWRAHLSAKQESANSSAGAGPALAAGTRRDELRANDMAVAAAAAPPPPPPAMEKEAAVEEKKKAPEPAPALAEADAKSEGATRQAFVAAPVAPPVVATPEPRKPEPKPELAKPKSETAGALADKAPAKPETFDTPQAWLAHIRKLRDAGKVEEARRELAAFRLQYPKRILLPDLKELEATDSSANKR